MPRRHRTCRCSKTLDTVTAQIPRLQADLAAIDSQTAHTAVIRRGVRAPTAATTSTSAIQPTTPNAEVGQPSGPPRPRQLSAAQAQAVQLTAALAAPAANAALDAAVKAHDGDRERARRRRPRGTAQTAAPAAAAHFAANDLADARSAVDAATKAVADQLALLLSQASTSTALTATVDGLALRQRYRSALASQPPVWDLATIPFRATSIVHPARSGDHPADRRRHRLRPAHRRPRPARRPR